MLTRDLGMYEGAGAIERAFNDFQSGKLENNKTGIMIHHVIEQVDQGRAIMTREIECRQDEDLEQLKERFHSEEHRLIVEGTACIVKEILANREK
jgi:phosphoribosylglycinamide formyltransferase